MDRPVVSVVVPVYDEVAALSELVTRCRAALQAHAYELVVVDDGSTDGSPELLRALTAGFPELRPVLLQHNVGQFQATQEGLRAARAGTVAVLDGDLQDPPELLPDLIEKLWTAPAAVSVVFARKSSRDDPLWVRAGAASYNLLRALSGGTAVPSGVGSYCAMRRDVALAVTRLRARHMNLAAALAALGARCQAISYDKGPRHDDRSRVGALGLVREAWGSLAITGSLQRLAGGAAVFCAAVTTLSACLGQNVASAVAGAVTLAAAGTAVGAHAARRRFLRGASGDPPP